MNKEKLLSEAGLMGIAKYPMNCTPLGNSTLQHELSNSLGIFDDYCGICDLKRRGFPTAGNRENKQMVEMQIDDNGSSI